MSLVQGVVQDCSVTLSCSAGIACRMLNGVLGAWYMRSCSINLLFVVVVLTTLKVTKA